MKITKFGQCCLLIEEKGLRIVTDPGMYSTAQNELKNIDVVLITHEHADHFHVDSVKKIITNNPNVKIITNGAVGALLAKENIPFTLVADGQTSTEKGILFEGMGTDHAIIWKDLGKCENTSYFIGGKLFYPGDSFYNPKRAVDILALPVAGPWMKISEAIDYLLAVNPKKAFPVHDAILSNPSMVSVMIGRIHLGDTKFTPLEIGKEYEF